MLAEAYGGNALSRAQCYRWIEKFQNGDFDVRNARSVADQQKNLKMLNCKHYIDEDDGQTQARLAEQLNVDQSTVSRPLKAMGKTIKVGRWVPHELTDRQQENRKIVCEMLLSRYKRKSYLLRIVTGDEKLIYFENPKRNRLYVDLGQPSKSTARKTGSLSVSDCAFFFFLTDLLLRRKCLRLRRVIWEGDFSDFDSSDA
ncbi:mariner Mos1 transposase [Trichonephila clavipes]|nr:mariner Mos1 transposase [Trichonephila clavipes]